MAFLCGDSVCFLCAVWRGTHLAPIVVTDLYHFVTLTHTRASCPTSAAVGYTDMINCENIVKKENKL